MDPSVLGISWKRQLYHRWMALRNVPFRRRWFVGYDLEGNSYWEFIDRNNPTRLRRQVSFERPYYHFGDFKPHPMWMQWLQHTRRGPPTLPELVGDMQRQHRLRLLAQRADEKWRSVPLKSSGSADRADPRIGSAWTGAAAAPGEQPQAAPAHAIEPAAEPAAAPVAAAPDQLVRDAMRQAEERVRRAPRVVRDANGTTAAPRRGQQPDAPTASAAARDRQAPDARDARSVRDEPTTASFKPKARA